MSLKVQSLHVYPVKSCRGQDVQQMDLVPMGPVGDRRAMIVDAQGQFLTQRSHGDLAQIKPHFLEEGLVLNIAGQALTVVWSPDRLSGRVWNDLVDVQLADDFVNKCLSAFLKQSVRLVRMDEKSKRHTSGTWADSDVSLADGYPILVTHTASLKALSDYAGIDISMAQFRPNIVLDGQDAWSEDSWRELKIGSVEIELVKPCTRCQVTTLDPISGNLALPETMQAMSVHRRSGDQRVKGVLFGWNAVVRKAGKIFTGDPVRIISKRDSWPIK